MTGETVCFEFPLEAVLNVEIEGTAEEQRQLAERGKDKEDWGMMLWFLLKAAALDSQQEYVSKVTLDTPPGTKVRLAPPEFREDPPWVVIGPSYNHDGSRTGWLVIQLPGEGGLDGYYPEDLVIFEERPDNGA